MIKLEVTIDGDAANGLRDFASRDLPQRRRKLVREAMDATLASTIDLNPIRTGRSRAAWAAAQGGIEGGIGPQQAREGSSTTLESEQTTELTATNSVPYITYLEYGTRKMAPVAMVRKSLLKIARRVASLFRI